MLVPESVIVPFGSTLSKEVISTPGASISTQVPPSEKSAKLSSISVAPIVITPTPLAGDKVHASPPIIWS